MKTFNDILVVSGLKIYQGNSLTQEMTFGISLPDNLVLALLSMVKMVCFLLFLIGYNVNRVFIKSVEIFDNIVNGFVLIGMLVDRLIEDFVMYCLNRGMGCRS